MVKKIQVINESKALEELSNIITSNFDNVLADISDKMKMDIDNVSHQLQAMKEKKAGVDRAAKVIGSVIDSLIRYAKHTDFIIEDKKMNMGFSGVSLEIHFSHVREISDKKHLILQKRFIEIFKDASPQMIKVSNNETMGILNL